MSGLFATLAAAARWGEGTLQSRPRGTFEPDTPLAAFGSDENEQLIGDAVHDAAGPLPPRPSPAGKGRGQPAGHLLLPDADTPHGTARADPPASGPRSATAHEAARPEELRASGLSPNAPEPTAGDGRPIAQQAVGRRNPPPSPLGDEPADTSVARAPSEFAPRGAEGGEPPLLLGPLTAAEGGSAADPLSPPPREPAAPRTAERRSLNIGRIEVRTPPPPPSQPQQTFRATTIPRALPRQSLDDYRRKGR
jgi:hypothetical protein